MITLKYAKLDTAVFISHIDTLRGMARTVRRMNVDVDYSKGFNPHMLLFFSPPLPIGISSLSEYMHVDCKGVTPDEFLQLFNSCAPQGFCGEYAIETEKNPNLAGKISAADYLLPVGDKQLSARIVEAVSKSGEYVVSYTQKGEQASKDVRSLILEIEQVGDDVCVRLATGNSNLRADRLAKQFNADFGSAVAVTSIKKLKQYVLVDGGLQNADDYLKKLGEALK